MGRPAEVRLSHPPSGRPKGTPLASRRMQRQAGPSVQRQTTDSVSGTAPCASMAAQRWASSATSKDIDYARKVTLVDRITQAKSSIVQVICGNPDPAFVGTSYIERFNATLRNMCRRYFRRTLAASKTLQNHEYAVALNMFAYNFCHIHGSLRVTPAMAAGLTDHVWTLHELLEVME